jgi:UDP-N-acetylmuramoylalanine--D-glutamate ligase
MLLVTAAARQIGLSPASIEAGLRSFRGVPHRLEPLGCIGGTQVFNDSKATNYDAAAVGLRAMQGPVVVLAGGSTKQGDASDWLRELHRKACAVVLFGAGAAELKELITTANFPGPLTLCEDLPAAVDQALQSADGLGASSLLLSPACASFDQYRDFEARGDHFKQLIQQVQSGAN